MNDNRHEEEAVRRQIADDLERFDHLSQEDLECLVDEAGIAKDDDLRRILQEPPLQYTPEQVERIQRDFIQEVFRSLDTEAQALLRLTAAALPLSNTQELLRKEFADARRAGDLTTLVAKVDAVGPSGYVTDLSLLENRYQFARYLKERRS